jgi:hypothetical protein
MATPARNGNVIQQTLTQPYHNYRHEAAKQPPTKARGGGGRGHGNHHQPSTGSEAGRGSLRKATEAHTLTAPPPQQLNQWQ